VLINSQGEYFSLFDLILPDVQNFGCCVNVPINYMDANNTALGVNQAADNLFDGCHVGRYHSVLLALSLAKLGITK